MTDDLTFYTNPMSRGRIVRWMLEEIGHPYQTEILDYASTMKGPGYLAINPMGKVPAIVHRGKVVTECAAICAYLADAFPDAGLAPPPTDRADYYRWMFFAAGPLEAAVTDKSLGVSIPAERKPMVGYGGLEEVVAALEKALTGKDFIAANRFSAADVYVGSQIRWGLAIGMVPASPAFQSYSDRLGERPALIRATEIDDALMPQKEPA
jgi:glutathione S-transferase